MSEETKTTNRPDSKQLAANRLGLRLDSEGNYQLDAQSLIASNDESAMKRNELNHMLVEKRPQGIFIFKKQ